MANLSGAMLNCGIGFVVFDDVAGAVVYECDSAAFHEFSGFSGNLSNAVLC